MDTNSERGELIVPSGEIAEGYIDPYDYHRAYVYMSNGEILVCKNRLTESPVWEKITPAH